MAEVVDVDPEAAFEQLIGRLVESAAYAAECSAAVFFAVQEDGSARVQTSFGGAFAGLSTAHCSTLLTAIDSMEGASPIFFGVPGDLSFGLELFIEARDPAPRFLAIAKVLNEAGGVVGLLAVTDKNPREALSPAKAYVMLSQALQISDALILKRSNQRPAAANAIQSERLRLLESVVVNAKDSILITEAEPRELPGPRIVYCNAAFTATTGYSEDEVLGKTPRILQGADTDPVATRRIRETLLAWKPIEIELLNYKKGGEPFWVELSIVPVADERGWFTHWVSVQRDVTERRIAVETRTRAMLAEAGNQKLQGITDELRLALDAAEAANVAKSQFLANMSHEIRTPLNGVLGMTQALWMDDLTPSQRERVAIIRDCGRSLLAVLNDILDLSKIESGRLELEVVAFDINQMAAAVCAAFTELANRNGVSFGATVSDDASGYWLGDSVRIRQILYNLASNGLKFTGQGEVQIQIDRDEDGNLRFKVRDTGIGMAADKITSLFSKFYQTDNSITRRFGGTGLGLAISRQLCDLMGGAITVQSVEGVGSTFCVTLPLEKIVAPETAILPAQDRSGEDDERILQGIAKLRVLAAEDNPANQLVLRALLQAFNISPTFVGNGKLAVEAWKTQAFDVILMDIQMPVMDGLSATNAVREHEARHRLARTPIVALSANAMTHQVREYLAKGMDGHVAKPIDIDQLAQALAGIALAKMHPTPEGDDGRLSEVQLG
jgi:PAS domain S-box-containing protein